MAYWLFKSEPDVFSFEMLKAKGKTAAQWDGVRNYQARNNMRAMKVGDLGFLHSISGSKSSASPGLRRGPSTRPPTIRAGNASTSAPCAPCRSRFR